VHLSAIARVTGMLLMVFSLTMLTPVPVALLYGEATMMPFALACGVTLSAGAALWHSTGRMARELRTRDGFVITTLFYLALGLFGALPLHLVAEGMSYTDAAFESLSGLTTTGATVMTGLDEMPRSILFYRQQLQWLGGMGIIILAVAVLPMLGIGGMQLYRAELPGPVKDAKLTPRISETAKALWYIYLGLTLACTLAYAASGMSVFDAVCHSLSTVSTGGFSPHDASFGYFDNAAAEGIAVVFMLVCGINFGLHFTVWRRWRPALYGDDAETRFYLGGIAAIAVAAVVLLIAMDVFPPPDALRAGLFQVVSVATSTGYTTENFSVWPSLLPFTIFLAAFMGGCAGSTSGGLKVIRVLLLWRQGVREIRRLIHPNAVIPIKLGRNTTVPDRVIEAVWGYFSAYVGLFVVMSMVLMATGVDFVTAWSAVGSCLNNLGPGLGEVALNYAGLSALAKWTLALAMLLGRLEIFTLLVLIHPAFWRS